MNIAFPVSILSVRFCIVFVRGSLKSITINDSQIANFEALAGCTELTTFEMKKATGVTSLAPLKSLPNLKRVVVSKGAFPEAELGGFAQTVKVEQR